MYTTYKINVKQFKNGNENENDGVTTYLDNYRLEFGNSNLTKLNAHSSAV